MPTCALSRRPGGAGLLRKGAKTWPIAHSTPSFGNKYSDRLVPQPTGRPSLRIAGIEGAPLQPGLGMASGARGQAGGSTRGIRPRARMHTPPLCLSGRRLPSLLLDSAACAAGPATRWVASHRGRGGLHAAISTRPRCVLGCGRGLWSACRRSWL